MSGAVLIAAPSSGSGKTTLTLSLLRAFRRDGLRVGSAKIGPDYIDPAFHTAASGRPCVNLDAWAMRETTFAALAGEALRDCELLIAEGVMGLFDGANAGGGSSADVACSTGWPIVLVVDAGGMAASAAALVHGFASFREDVDVAGVIFNRVGSNRHGALLRAALEPLGIPVLGSVKRDPSLTLADRHLGLVQAGEHPDLEGYLDRSAALICEQVDLDALRALAASSVAPTQASAVLPIPPLGAHIAIARDVAFAFSYPATLRGWHGAGAELSFFSPLADEGPDARADAVYLPGGYPELHAGRLATCRQFRTSMHAAVTRGAQVFAECGGYMVLGEQLTDADGQTHPMLGCLPVRTSFARRKLSLGYRQLTLLEAGPLGGAGARFRGHEFHFATEVAEAERTALFAARDAAGRDLGPVGARVANIAASFIHLIDQGGGE